jgi:hypothetical protein
MILNAKRAGCSRFFGLLPSDLFEVPVMEGSMAQKLNKKGEG